MPKYWAMLGEEGGKDRAVRAAKTALPRSEWEPENPRHNQQTQTQS
jgi:hypothetical protein